MQNNKNREGFPEILRRLRKRNRLSMCVLSELCGFGRDTIRKYETGEIKRPSQAAVESIARYFDVSTEYLMGNSKEP